MNDELVAQSSTAGAAMSATAVFFVFLLVLAFYVYYSYSLRRIAEKTNTPNTWLAWVPIINFFYTIKVAKLSSWWIVGMLIPFLNIFVMAYAWMRIAVLLQRPQWLGLLMIISPVNLIVLWFLAFREAGDSVIDISKHSNPPADNPPADNPPTNSTPAN